MQTFLFTPAKDLDLSLLTKTLCNRNCLFSPAWFVYEFVGLSTAPVRLSRHSRVCGLETGCSARVISTQFVVLFPPVPEEMENKQCCPMHRFLLPQSPESWSPVNVSQGLGTDGRDTRARKFPLVTCCSRFTVPCFASAEVASVWVGQK